MASPESGKPTPKSPPVQDSPIFGYVSSLSPIKPVNARSGVQMYDNLDVPSPQLIFKTPNFIRPRNTSLLDSSQYSALSDTQNLSPGYTNGPFNTREFSENMNTSGSSLALPTTHLNSYGEKECTTGDPSPSQSCISPSNCVDAFLTDPLENGENSSSSPDFCVKRAAKDLQHDRITSNQNKMKSLNEDILPDSCTSAIPVNEQVDESPENSTLVLLHCSHSKEDAFPDHNSENGSEEPTMELHLADAEIHTSRTSLREPSQVEDDLRYESCADATEVVNKSTIAEQLRLASKNVSICNDSVKISESNTKEGDSSGYQHATDYSLESTTKGHDVAHLGREVSTSSAAQCHGRQYLSLQTGKTSQSDELDCTPQLQTGSPQNFQAGDNCIDNSGQTSSGATANQIPIDQEDGAQQQRGKRKRLQFEAVENLRICNRSSCNYTTQKSSVDFPIARLEVQKVNALNLQFIPASSTKQVTQPVPANDPCRLVVKVDRSGPCKEVLSLAAPRPSGIGLHLNSIVSATSLNPNPNMPVSERHASMQIRKSLPEDNDEVSERAKNYSSSGGLIGPEKSTLSSETSLPYSGNKNDKEKLQRNQSFKAKYPFTIHQPPLVAKPLNSSLPLKHIDRYMTPCIMKKLPSEEASKDEESTHTSPKKKRKKASDSDGQKRCNCKRSKCLKLYCDCFAAGSFCSEACACRDCFNKVEHEDTVRETKQQIESRNPLAFAPKVVLRVSDPPKESGDRKPITPSSGRHKRGCNCKRSLCLKKYCECFQAGVGCSLGCRCEGCKNSFGMKDGCELSEIVVEHRRPKEGWERDLSGELEDIEVKKNQLSNPKHCHPCLSPLTPSIQSSTIGNEEASSSIIPCDPELEQNYSSGEPETFSPGWDGFPDLCNLSPLLKFSPSVVRSSAASTGERKVLQMKLFEGSSRISLGPLSWRSGSPITPLPRFGESKFLREPDTDSALHCHVEDDTPEILKESCSPIKAVKATSPNQKRVSPPKQVACGTTSSISPSGGRSVRKFILQSVPSFPPLTPYTKNSKDDET